MIIDLATHKKHLACMRAYLVGKRYFKALNAMEKVFNLEQGFRKDGITPKFHHQLTVARICSTYEHSLIYPEPTLIVAFLHDLLEDHGEQFNTEWIAEHYNTAIANTVWRLTKKTLCLNKDTSVVFNDIATDPIASIVKCADRIHNLQTMLPVFSPEKQMRYIQEVHDLFHPMIKAARRHFPEQELAYENLKLILLSQCELITNLNEVRLNMT